MTSGFNLKLEESALEERQSQIHNRRRNTDRRNNSNPNYKVPSRRMTLDWRQRIHGPAR